MKQILFILLFASFSLSACSLDNSEDPLTVYREIAYNYLSMTEKNSIVGDWKKAEVAAWLDGNYVVTFQTNDSALGPIRVVVDPDTGRAVEKLPRN
jgi:hypothetical protein